MELAKRISEEKTEFSALSKEAHDQIYPLLFMPWGNLNSTIVVEKSIRERCLEALADWCKTSKEVCERLHPSLSQYTKEKNAGAMKATSMLLLRLSNPNTRLVSKRRRGKICEYHITAEGMKRLSHYVKERERRLLRHKNCVAG